MTAPFTVERKRQRTGKVGEAIRQGRADKSAAVSAGAITLTFEERADGCCYVLVRKAEVGVICRQRPDAGELPGFNWLCFLPEQRRAPSFAADLDKAKDAMRVTVESWCAAAGLCARAKRPPRGTVQGWRAGDGAR